MSERLEEIKKQIKLLRGDMSVTSIEVDIDADIILDDMEWLVEQTERVEWLVENRKVLEDELHEARETGARIYEQNKRYRNLLESLNNTHNIASEIMREQPDKKIIDANDILQYILRKINDELERETE